MAVDLGRREKNGLIKLKLPPRPQKNRKTAQAPEMIKLAIPPRPENKKHTLTAKKTPSEAAGALTEKTPEELAKLASSVVMIYCCDSSGKVIAGGSGIMIGRRGFILTNRHVITDSASFTVKIENDEKVYETDEIIKYNGVYDLAVIRIERFLDPIPLCPPERAPVRGQRVIAIGSPLGFFNTVSDGIISGFRDFGDVVMTQFTAPISKGSSGGAVLNMFGELIGISTAGVEEGQNINLFVGSDYIRGFVKGLV